MIRTIPERLQDLAQAAPEREILRYRFLDGSEIVLTRAELLKLAESTAEQLEEAGASDGDIVAIVQRHPLALIGTFFGITGIAAVPSILPFATEKLHPDRYQASMAALFDLVQPALLVTEPELYDEVAALLPSPAPEKPTLLSIDVGAQCAAPLQPISDPDAIALLQHSSGTTGLQKGVALSHRAIFDQLDAYSQA
ncbi:MAG: AMP-binding protein, partial [Burkholderiales bacterium]|nr:AMP-binding protein [Anaerolineae bacterium]